MENTDKKENLNLFQKLLEIQKEILGLSKDGKSYGYDYTTGNKVLEHIKPLMNEYGLLLKQEVLSFSNERQDYKTKTGNKSEILTSVSMKFTWVDAETGEKDENLWGANGQNDWEKGFGSALTYGERYFLLKYFHINTDADDIDNPNRKTSSPIPDKKVKQPQQPAKNEKVLIELVKDSPEWNALMVFFEEGKVTRMHQITKQYKVSDKLIVELQKMIDDSENEKLLAETIANEQAEESVEEVKENISVDLSPKTPEDAKLKTEGKPYLNRKGVLITPDSKPEKKEEIPKNTTRRLPALDNEAFETAKKGNKTEILKVLAGHRMAKNQREELEELAKK